MKTNRELGPKYCCSFCKREYYDEFDARACEMVCLQGSRYYYTLSDINFNDINIPAGVPINYDGPASINGMSYISCRINGVLISGITYNEKLICTAEPLSLEV